MKSSGNAVVQVDLAKDDLQEHNHDEEQGLEKLNNPHPFK